MNSTNQQDEQLQQKSKFVIQSETTPNTSYMSSCKPIQEDEFERLPDYVQQFIISSEDGSLPSTTKDELKEVVNSFFNLKK